MKTSLTVCQYGLLFLGVLLLGEVSYLWHHRLSRRWMTAGGRAARVGR